MNLLRIFTLILLNIFAANSQAATYFKWLDEHGRINYSQTKPINKKADLIKANIYPPVSAYSTKTKAIISKKTAADKKPVKQSDSDKQSADAKPKKNKKACTFAQKSLQTLQNKGQIRQRNANGEVRRLSDKEKQNSIKRIQKVIKKNC